MAEIDQELRTRLAERVYMEYEFVGQVLEASGWMVSMDGSEWSRELSLSEIAIDVHHAHHAASVRQKVRFAVRFNPDHTVRYAVALDERGQEHGAPGERFPLPTISTSETEHVPKAVQLAVEHLANVFPKVTHLFFSRDGRWFYCDDDFAEPKFLFRSRPEIDVDLLKAAAKSLKKLPAAFRVPKIHTTRKQ